MRYGVLVRAALEETRQRREAVRKKMVTEVFKALEELSARVRFNEAFLFGSLVRPYAFNDHSDIDLAFSHLSNDVFFFTIAFLSERLGRDVDVVQIEKASRIRTRILKEGIRWTKKNSVF